MNPVKMQPALLAGIAIGVLSALPVVNLANFCCCAWVVFGGGLAAYLMQQNHPAPITTGDGAVVGLMAGAIGAVVGTVLSIPIALAMGPFQAEMMERVLQGTQEMPPEARAVFDQMRESMTSGAMVGIGFIFSLLFSLCFYSVFGLLGGLLGTVIFRKNTPPPPPLPPPPPPAPTGGFDQPPFTPPPPPPAT